MALFIQEFCWVLPSRRRLVSGTGFDSIDRVHQRVFLDNERYVVIQARLCVG